MARPDPAADGNVLMTAHGRAGEQPFMAASQVRPAAVNPVDDLSRRCEEAFVAVQQSLAQRGAFLPEGEVAVLRQLPGQLVLQILAGLDALTVRNPGALLRWTLGQPNVQAALRGPPGQSVAPTGAGASTQPPAGAPGFASAPPAAGQQEVAATESLQSLVRTSDLQVSHAGHAGAMSVHCPGCSYSVPALSTCLAPPNPFRPASAMAFTSSWGERECGASWMCTRVPRSFGTGVGLSAWLLRRQASQPREAGATALAPGDVASPSVPMDMSRAEEPEHSACPRLFCWLCGGLFEHAICGPGLRDDKITVQWECWVCGHALVGCMESEGARCHVTAFWVEPVEPAATVVMYRSLVLPRIYRPWHST